VPVVLNVPSTKGKSLKGLDVITFRPRFMAQFYKSMQTKFFDKSKLQFDYARFLESANLRPESLQKTVFGAIKAAKSSAELQKVEFLAQRCMIIANQSMIAKAEMEEDKENKDITYNLKLSLKGEGGDRLWKFSAQGGQNLLVVSDDVPIASATIGTQLNGAELVIKQITDKALVSHAVEILQTR
jgi:hypothetical protein